MVVIDLAAARLAAVLRDIGALVYVSETAPGELCLTLSIASGTTARFHGALLRECAVTLVVDGGERFRLQPTRVEESGNPIHVFLPNTSPNGKITLASVCGVVLGEPPGVVVTLHPLGRAVTAS